MACSKKDYVAVAALVKARMENMQRDIASAQKVKAADRVQAICERRAGVESVAWDLAAYFGSQSQAFDKNRFLKACGVGV